MLNGVFFGMNMLHLLICPPVRFLNLLGFQFGAIINKAIINILYNYMCLFL